MTGWPLAPLRRLRTHQARAAARALGEALAGEARSALEVARRLQEAEAAARATLGGTLEAARLAGAAACAERHAAELLEAQAVARRAATAVAGRREGLLAARAEAGLLEPLEAGWAAARRRARLRAEEGLLDDLGQGGLGGGGPGTGARRPAGRSLRRGPPG